MMPVVTATLRARVSSGGKGVRAPAVDHVYLGHRDGCPLCQGGHDTVNDGRFRLRHLLRAIHGQDHAVAEPEVMRFMPKATIKAIIAPFLPPIMLPRATSMTVEPPSAGKSLSDSSLFPLQIIGMTSLQLPIILSDFHGLSRKGGGRAFGNPRVTSGNVWQPSSKSMRVRRTKKQVRARGVAGR